MNRKYILTAVFSAMTLATVAFALDMAIKTDPDAIVASRIQGTWTADATLNSRLDAQRTVKDPLSLTFTDNPGVLPGLQAASDRFKNDQIFGAGIVNVDGTTHPYILVGEHGGTRVVWFTGDAAGTNATATSTSKSVMMGVGRDSANDILFLGGDAKAEPSSVYIHPAKGR